MLFTRPWDEWVYVPEIPIAGNFLTLLVYISSKGSQELSASHLFTSKRILEIFFSGNFKPFHRSTKKDNPYFFFLEGENKF